MKNKKILFAVSAIAGTALAAFGIKKLSEKITKEEVLIREADLLEEMLNINEQTSCDRDCDCGCGCAEKQSQEPTENVASLEDLVEFEVSDDILEKINNEPFDISNEEAK